MQVQRVSVVAVIRTLTCVRVDGCTRMRTYMCSRGVHVCERAGAQVPAHVRACNAGLHHGVYAMQSLSALGRGNLARVHATLPHANSLPASRAESTCTFTTANKSMTLLIQQSPL